MSKPRDTISFVLDKNIQTDKILSWGRRFDPFIFLNGNSGLQSQNDRYSSCDLLFAAGSIETMKTGLNVFDALKTFHSAGKDWVFGYISYDIKNQVERLTSSNFDGIEAGDYYFFRPRYIIEIKNESIFFHYDKSFDDEASVSKIFSEIKQEEVIKYPENIINIIPRVSKEEYIKKVNKIRNHIRRGDIYEMNYCIEFFSENALIDPVTVYDRLNAVSPMPFSAYIRTGNHYVMCASPERFLAKRGNKIISQPIKGTAKRGTGTMEDENIIEKLRNDPKEKAENVMIVDLVRNDLSRTASRGSVNVEELFNVKTFRQLHQLVSTVTSELKKDVHFTEVLKTTFPMGSMTGAPKIMAMKLIEEYESSKRGIYSGTIGYISPSGDFDFNVVIRSILYNAEKHYLSYMAGSAITYGADAEKEFEECMLKASSMKKVLGDINS